MAILALEQTSSRVFRDYLSLAKPMTIVPHFITASAAMFLAAGGPPAPAKLLATLSGGGLVAAAANALNCYFDRDLDRRMARTMTRPLPAGRILPQASLLLAAITGLAGLAVLGLLVGLVASGLALGALVYYVLGYTIVLKRHTRWSALLASGTGAVTPLIGWLAVTGEIAAAPLFLAAMVLLWTLPHFWSLAVFRRSDYERAGLEALPARGTTAWIACCSLLLVACSLVLAPFAGLGPLYRGAAVALGAGLLYLALPSMRRERLRSARRLYLYSLFYIAALFTAIIIDTLI